MTVPDIKKQGEFIELYNERYAAAVSSRTEANGGHISPKDEYALGMEVCDAIGRSNCGGFFEDLYDAYAETLDGLPLSDDFAIPAGLLARLGKGAKPARSSCSFDADTPVLMVDGSTKQIKDIRPGDLVIATDETTGETRPEEVIRLHATPHDGDLVDLTIVDAMGRRQVVNATAHHPFWTASSKRWVPAARLVARDVLQGVNGEPVQLGAVEKRPGAATMHNLTISRLHTYYVVGGSVPILVHNKCGPGTGLKGASRGMSDLFADGTVRGKSIIEIRSSLLGDGFAQGLARNKKGYLFRNDLGEEVRIMRRGSGWDIRMRNRNGNYLDEFGNVAPPSSTHGIQVFSR